MGCDRKGSPGLNIWDATGKAVQMAEREYDLILYGASGFVGRHALEYLALHYSDAPLRWAIAGRNRERLELARAGVETTADVLVADSGDPASMDALAGRTRVLANTAGPFSLYGGTVVDACVRMRTHYVDISGETPWIKKIIDRYHAVAASEGTCIIPCCGFDSVPSDLGTYVMIQHMKQVLKCRCRRVKVYFRMYGGFNGGTIASLLTNLDPDSERLRHDPFLLNPPEERSKLQIDRNRDIARAMYDVDMQTWVGPFVMAPINTRVVRRSAALFAEWGEEYGPDFTYQEYLKYDPPFAMVKAATVTAGASLFERLMHNPHGRTALMRFLPKPGQGPSEKLIESGWFVCELHGLSETGQHVRGLIRYQGDPSNRATAHFLCEAALSLALTETNVPCAPSRGGVLTPATGLGISLATRLRKTGLPIEIVS